jgi:hypothetical protein
LKLIHGYEINTEIPGEPFLKLGILDDIHHKFPIEILSKISHWKEIVTDIIGTAALRLEHPAI